MNAPAEPVSGPDQVRPAVLLEQAGFSWPGASGPALDIERFEVRTGETLFLQGPSGSGKSTLLGLLGGVLVAQSGSVRILGTDMRQLSSRGRDRFRVDRVGFVFQQFNLISYLSVLDNVLLPCRLSSRRAAAAGADPAGEARRLLRGLDVSEPLWGRSAVALSVGQQQRVAVARALIGAPDLLIADEPTSALDAARQASFLELLTSQCRASGATLVFVSHDDRLARHFSRTVALASLNRAAVP